MMEDLETMAQEFMAGYSQEDEFKGIAAFVERQVERERMLMRVEAKPWLEEKDKLHALVKKAAVTFGQMQWAFPMHDGDGRAAKCVELAKEYREAVGEK